MSWINWDSIEEKSLPKQPDIIPELEVSKEPLPEHSSKNELERPNNLLSPIERPEEHVNYKLWPKHYKILDFIRSHKRTLVPFADIQKWASANLDLKHAGKACTALWLNGKLEKYTRGWYIMSGIRGKDRSRYKGDRGGQHYGVHYKVSDDNS